MVELRKRVKPSVIFLLIMMFVEIIAIAPSLSLLISNVVITSTGQITTQPTQYINAQSCSPQDIQAAVNQINAVGGGTVYVPSGIGNFTDISVTIPGGVNVIGAGVGNTIIRSQVPLPNNPMFEVDGSNGKKTRISGIEFNGLITSSNGDGVGSGLVLNQAIDFRIDHCKFVDFGDAAINVYNYQSGTTRGVIDHNSIDNPYKDIYTSPEPMWAYGIVIAGEAYAWDSDINKFLGKYETAPSGFPIVYIEDNNFSRCRHCIASTQGAWYVARYNNINEERPRNFGSIDVHGDAGGGAPGGRGLEAYGNTITGSAGYGAAQVFWIRGGGGVIFNNTMQNVAIGVGLFADNSNAAYKVKDLYIWGNSMNSGTLIYNAAGYTQNVDYFLVAKTGYTPYPYPHPLTL